MLYQGLGDPQVGPYIPPPLNNTSDIIISSQLDQLARIARCKSYTNQQNIIAAGIGLLAAVMLPGFWKLIALPLGVIVMVKYPTSNDCDYGF